MQKIYFLVFIFILSAEVRAERILIVPAKTGKFRVVGNLVISDDHLVLNLFSKSQSKAVLKVLMTTASRDKLISLMAPLLNHKVAITGVVSKTSRYGGEIEASAISGAVENQLDFADGDGFWNLD